MNIGSFLGYAIMLCMPLNLISLFFFYSRKASKKSLSNSLNESGEKISFKIILLIFAMIIISFLSVWVFLDPSIDVHASKYLFGFVVLLTSITSLLILRYLLHIQDSGSVSYLLLLDVNAKAIIGIFGLVYVELSLMLLSLYVAISLVLVNHYVTLSRKATWILKSLIVISAYVIIYYFLHLIFRVDMLDVNFYTIPVLFASVLYGMLFFFGGLISLIVSIGGDPLWGLKKLRGLKYDPRYFRDYSK